MTNNEILEKAIWKAIKNGFNPISDLGEVDNINIILSEDGTTGHIQFYTKDGDGGGYELETVLYGLKKTFAKAFARYLFKERELKLPDRFWIDIYQGTCDMLIEDIKDWYLQQIVLEKEPLKYLEKFLEEK